jgi:hypothetical protein
MQAVVVTLPNGNQYMPITRVKEVMHENTGLPVGAIIPIYVPSGVNPQAMIDNWRSGNGGYGDDFNFAATWRNGGPNDYKLQVPQGVYDSYGNFAYGATGIAGGFTAQQLQEMGQATHGGNNPNVNVLAIQAGINAVQQGGTVITSPVPWPSPSG